MCDVPTDQAELLAKHEASGLRESAAHGHDLKADQFRLVLRNDYLVGIQFNDLQEPSTLFSADFD